MFNLQLLVDKIALIDEYMNNIRFNPDFFNCSVRLHMNHKGQNEERKSEFYEIARSK